jgi:NADH dehydrogenase FAD-containing subunit
MLLSDGTTLACDFAFIAVGVTPSQLFVNSGIPVGHRGELWVDRTLRSPDYPCLLGGGDCIAVEGMRLAKVGVYAVRQNPILYHNIMAALEGTAFKRFSAGSSPMLILNMGDGTGILWKKGLTIAGEMVLRLKNFIDRRFMRKFQVSGELEETEELPGHVGIEREAPVGERRYLSKI